MRKRKSWEACRSVCTNIEGATRVLRCTRKAGHYGTCSAPIGGGDATFWPNPREQKVSA